MTATVHRDDTQPLPVQHRTGYSSAGHSQPSYGDRPGLTDGYPGHLRPDPARRRVVNRLVLVGRRHARHLVEQTGTASQPGPHAVVLFYRPALAGPRAEILIASRMFLHGDDVTHLPTVLDTLRQRALDYRRVATFDPLVHLTNRAEPLTHASRYLGLGTSSLRPGLPGDDDLPWTGLARLADGTRLSMDLTPGGSARVAVTSTHTLDTGAALAPSTTHTWRWASARPDDPERAAAHDALDGLHRLLLDVHRERGAR